MNNKKTIQVKDIQIEIHRKNIKNIYLRVLPPDGQVRVSAPKSVPDDYIRNFVLKKYNWIKKHVSSFQEYNLKRVKEYVSGESHYFKGKKYKLKIIYSDKPMIEIKNDYIYFYVPSHYTCEQRQNYYEKWLKKELKKELEILVPKWEKIIGVKANEIRIRKMKTKWGTCNILKKRIWFNLELIKKPRNQLEYVVVHELVHLIEKNHNKRFKEIMSKYLPDWKIYRKELNKFMYM